MLRLFKKKNKCFREENTLVAAANVVFDTNQASASMLQRRLKIDYEKAAQLMGELEAAGVVSAFNGVTPRHILASAQDFQSAISKIDARNITPSKIKAALSKKHQVDVVDEMDGHEFEYWCADLLQKNGFSGVEVTQGSGDQGVDVLAQKDGIKYAIQCKCYSSDLSNKPVQEVNAGRAIYRCHIGAVMTNRFFYFWGKRSSRSDRCFALGQKQIDGAFRTRKKGLVL